MIKHGHLAGLLQAAAVALVSVYSAAGPQHGARHTVALPNGFPAALCSRPPDQEAERIKRLAGSLAQSRAAAQQNPLLSAEVGYYDAELSASRRCLQTLASE